MSSAFLCSISSLASRVCCCAAWSASCDREEERERYVDGVDLSLAENELVLQGFELDLAVGNHLVHRGFPLCFFVSDRFVDDFGDRLIVFVQHLEHSLVLLFQLHAKLP